jgi:hypothetical protein
MLAGADKGRGNKNRGDPVKMAPVYAYGFCISLLTAQTAS